MTDPACYTYAKHHRHRFEEWLCSPKKRTKFKSQYKEVWEGTNTNAKDLFDFAAWAAGHAIIGPNKQPAKGFSIPKGRCILLELTGLKEIAENGAKSLPAPKFFNDQHGEWCNKVQGKAERCKIENWSYGRSAKLINVFLKAVMLCKHATPPGGKEKAKWDAVHPPIDRRVLTGMNDPKNPKRGEKRFGYEYPKWITLPGKNGELVRIPSGIPNWTLFNEGDYQNVIDMIRCNLIKCGETDPLPLWKNERFFKP